MKNGIAFVCVCAAAAALVGCGGSIGATKGAGGTAQGICTPTIPTSGEAPANVKGTSQTKVTISWVPPTTNENGSPIGNNLGGYDIYYNTSSTMGVIRLQDKCLTQYTILDLAPGAYEFSMTAENSQGAQGGFSPKVPFTVQPNAITEINLTTGLVHVKW